MWNKTDAQKKSYCTRQTSRSPTVKEGLALSRHGSRGIPPGRDRSLPVWVSRRVVADSHSRSLAWISLQHRSVPSAGGRRVVATVADGQSLMANQQPVHGIRCSQGQYCPPASPFAGNRLAQISGDMEPVRRRGIVLPRQAEAPTGNEGARLSRINI